MARISISGNAIVVTSSLTVEQLDTVKKYRPQSLTLFEGEGADKTPVFVVGIGDGTGSISKFGANFSRTAAADGGATITLIADLPAENKREFVAELIGTAILNINKVEEQIPAVLEEVVAEKAAVLENISAE